MGWVMGFEPTTPRTTTWCSNQLSYTHQRLMGEISLDNPGQVKSRAGSMAETSSHGGAHIAVSLPARPVPIMSAVV